jgi:ABC-2 type transport system ATP-binding protein
MARSGLELWWRAAALSLTATVLLATADVSIQARYPWQATVVAAVLVAAVLFAALARRPLRLRSLSRSRGPALVAKAAFLGCSSASEEILWRWFLLGELSSKIGVPAAFLVSTLGFAVVHGRWQGGRGVAVHVMTGSVFGGIFLVTGSLAAAIAAHVTYNLLIAVAVESARSTARPGRRVDATASAATVMGPAEPRAAGEPPARLRGVDKRFGSTVALDGVDLELRAGEILAVLGANGAGKSTAVSILVGLRRPDRGRAFLFGKDPRIADARRAVGATPQESGFPPTLTVTEIIDLVRAHYPRPLPADTVLERFGLGQLARRHAGGLSGGERRRLAVGLAFAGNPDVVFLDEPTTGLDVDARRSVWRAIQAFAEAGGTALVTTHNLAEAEEIATRVVVLAHGRVVADSTVPEIKARAGMKRIRLRGGMLPCLRGVERTVRDGDRWELYVEDPADVVRQLALAGASLAELEVGSVTLEEAYLVLTGGTG